MRLENIYQKNDSHVFLRVVDHSESVEYIFFPNYLTEFSTHTFPCKYTLLQILIFFESLSACSIGRNTNCTKSTLYTVSRSLIDPASSFLLESRGIINLALASTASSVCFYLGITAKKSTPRQH